MCIYAVYTVSVRMCIYAVYTIFIRCVYAVHTVPVRMCIYAVYTIFIRCVYGGKTPYAWPFTEPQYKQLAVEPIRTKQEKRCIWNNSDHFCVYGHTHHTCVFTMLHLSLKTISVCMGIHFIPVLLQCCIFHLNLRLAYFDTCPNFH